MNASKHSIMAISQAVSHFREYIIALTEMRDCSHFTSAPSLSSFSNNRLFFSRKDAVQVSIHCLVSSTPLALRDGLLLNRTLSPNSMVEADPIELSAQLPETMWYLCSFTQVRA